VGKYYRDSELESTYSNGAVQGGMILNLSYKVVRTGLYGVRTVPSHDSRCSTVTRATVTVTVTDQTERHGRPPGGGMETRTEAEGRSPGPVGGSKETVTPAAA
jgi:hypothetical protein